MSNKSIIFFDGKCNLCDRFVNFVFKRDMKRRFLYSPLQGQTALQKLQREDIEGLKSILVLKEGHVLKEAQAIQTVLKEIYPRFSMVLLVFPSSFFNLFYRFIAKRRYTFFGKKENFYQAAQNQKNFFLP